MFNIGYPHPFTIFFIFPSNSNECEIIWDKKRELFRQTVPHDLQAYKHKRKSLICTSNVQDKPSVKKKSYCSRETVYYLIELRCTLFT